MRRIFAVVLLVASVVLAIWIDRLVAVALVIAVGVIAWRVSLCPHAGPLALLPATTDLDGTPLPTRWCCDDCGRIWPANLDRPQTPTKKFHGHDESKASAAAERAKEHADKSRQLALQRAGLGKSAIITDASEFDRRRA